MDQPGEPRDHPPRKGFWARFSEQETGPQKVLVGLAGTMTALATTVGGVYAVTNVLHDDPATVAEDPTGAPQSTATVQPSSSATSSASSSASSSGSTAPTAPTDPGFSVEPGQVLVAQGSKEADELVHLLVDQPGARAELDHVIIPEAREQRLPYIMRLWYNCQGLPEGQPPGPDLCSSVYFTFDDAFPPGPGYLKNPRRIVLQGIWADTRPTGAGYAAEGLVVYPAPASS